MGRRSLAWLAALLVIGVVLSACGSDEVSKRPVAGSELLAVPFDTAGDWEEATYPPGAETPVSRLVIRDGRYEIEHRAERSASFIWGAGGGAYQDVIIEVSTEQLSAEDDNLYGVLCRLESDASGSQTGYALLISGDGHYGIARLRNDSFSFLLEWHQTSAIHTGQRANTIRAVCVGDYLALYANDKFLGEVKDSTYRRAGQVGLVAGVVASEVVHVTFDDLAVYEGTLGD